MIDDERKAWLRGAYLDRITEAAMHFAADRTHFVDAEWREYIANEFDYLSELTTEDHGYLREQAGLEAFRGIVAALSSAREEAFGKLIVDNADVIQSDARFALDLGWISLLQHVAERVCTYPSGWKVKIDGAKEKFGCLVVHIACDYSARGCRSEVERLREEVRLRSLATCEICGSAGRLRLSGFAKTVCDKHVGVLGDLREDDGRWADPWKWHEEGDGYPPESAELLKDLEPVRPRPKDHVIDRGQTAISLQIEADIDKNYGRKADLLLEFCGALEIAVVAAMSVADDDVDHWLRSEVDRFQGVQPLSEEDREFLHRCLRSLAIDERGRRHRREEGLKSLQRFFGENPALGREADQLVGRERELLDAYAGDLADSAHGSVVKVEFLNGYIRDEIALWPHVLELSEGDKEWLRAWLRKMIDAEYGRIKGKD